jgi:hemerythrin
MAEAEATSWLEWSDDFVTGDAETDAHHREILARARRFVEALGSQAQEEEVGATLRFLLDFVARHFKSEEALMDSVAYPQRQKHHAAHQALFQQLGALLVLSRTPDDEAKLPERIEVFLHSYFKGHLRAHDAPMAKFVAAQRA